MKEIVLTREQMNKLSEAEWERLKEIAVLHTRLAMEFSDFPFHGGSTVEEAGRITRRKADIKREIEVLRAERERILAN